MVVREGAPASAEPASTDALALRRDFPILEREVHGKPLVYLDNAASAQRPRQVTEAMDDCYERYYSNIHRGVHTLSQESTKAYEQARASVARFLGAAAPSEVIFVRGTTEAINLVAQSWGGANLQAGDEILVTEADHHSNLVPWQMIAQRTGAVIVAARINERVEITAQEVEKHLSERTRVVAIHHVSNATGTVAPVRDIADAAHRVGALVVVDGAQGVPHLPVDVESLGADFYACSAHKMYGPSGIGALWGRQELLDAMPPWQGGGGMIERVGVTSSTWAPVPMRFEAGTPAIAEAVGFDAAVRYLEEIGLESVEHHERQLLSSAKERLSQLEPVTLIGAAQEQAGVLSFTVRGIHPHDLGTILDQQGVAVRAGHHCAQPLMEALGVPATVRASFALYNTEEEIERLASAVAYAIELFGIEPEAPGAQGS